MKKYVCASINRCVPVPIGYKFAKCPICNSTHLTGILLHKDADEQDLNIICNSCGKIITAKTV